MDEIFTKETPMSYYEQKVLELRKEGKNEDADRLAFLLATVKIKMQELSSK